jgi:hypothetical protein
MSAATHHLLPALHLALSAALFWTCFCRQTRSTVHTTRADIRAAFWLLSIAAVVIGVAPYASALLPELFPPYTITWPDLLLLAGIVVVQGVTAQHWRDGVPVPFQREDGPTQWPHWPWGPGESSTLPPLRPREQERLERQINEVKDPTP